MKSAVAIIVLLPIVVVTAPLAPDAKVLKIDTPTSVRLCLTCKQQQAMFAVTVLPDAGKIVLKPGEKPRVISASASGTRIPQLENALQASWEAPAGVPKALVLTIDPVWRTAGTYDIAIDLLPATRPRAPAETVHLVVAAAALQGPDKLFVHHTKNLLFEDERHSTPLVLFETGRVSGIEKLEVRPMSFVHDNEPLEAAPLTPSNAAPVVAGEPYPITYEISDDIPLGLTTGSVRAMAPELSAALVIPVEIRSRLSDGYLAWAIILGLILSYQVKVRLQQRLQRSQARAAAATLLRDVVADRSRFPDAKFRQDIDQTLNALNAAVGQTDATVIEDARKALDTAWRNALQNLETRRAAFRTELDGWQKLVSLAWEAPPAVTPVITDARNGFAPAATLEQGGDVAGATAALEGTRRTTATRLHETGRAWQQASRRFFNELFAAEAGVSDAILTALKAASDAWRGVYEAIEPPATGEPALVQPLLRQITGEYVTVRDHLRDVPRHLEREFDQVAAALTANNADPDLVAAIERQLAVLAATLASAIDEPATAVHGVVTVLDALQQAWADAFASAISDDPKEVEKKVKRRDFRGAADLLGTADLLSITDAAGAADTESARRAALAAGIRSAPHAPGASLIFGNVPAASPYEMLLLESQRDIKNTKRIQTLIVGVLFLAWALSTSSATFDGTWLGLLAALFSAFGVDVGVDVLRARVKGALLG